MWREGVGGRGDARNMGSCWWIRVRGCVCVFISRIKWNFPLPGSGARGQIQTPLESRSGIASTTCHHSNRSNSKALEAKFCVFWACCARGRVGGRANIHTNPVYGGPDGCGCLTMADSEALEQKPVDADWMPSILRASSQYIPMLMLGNNNRK